MILDLLENAGRYRSLHEGFEAAFDFLCRPDLADLPLGRHGIDGDRVYAIVARESGRTAEGALLETHDRYVDIQYILSGTDTMGWKPRSLCTQPAREYDAQADIAFFSDRPDAWVAVQGGAFAVFFPEDAHMPLISDGPIHKVVVKIAAMM